MTEAPYPARNKRNHRAVGSTNIVTPDFNPGAGGRQARTAAVTGAAGRSDGSNDGDNDSTGRYRRDEGERKKYTGGPARRSSRPAKTLQHIQQYTKPD